MQEFLNYLLTNIVKNPGDVKVSEILEGNTYNYQILVNADDMGLVIGKEGRIIRSIRSLAKSKAIKEGVMINVELLEPDGTRRPRPTETTATGETTGETAVEAESAEPEATETVEEATDEVAAE